MNNFLEASKVKLRFNTTIGILNVEQLWDLSLTKLAVIIKTVKKSMQETDNDDDLSFLDESKTVDKIQQLKFDILKEVYTIKKEEADKIKLDAEHKLHNEKIMSLIHQKQEASLGEKSLDELKAMLK
jgi:hypothetical protein